MGHYEDVACLPGCDERHAEDCPRFEAEKSYWAAYFGVGTPAFWNFKPGDCSCNEHGRDPECQRHAL
jgi:hypothetical protein